LRNIADVPYRKGHVLPEKPSLMEARKKDQQNHRGRRREEEA